MPGLGSALSLEDPSERGRLPVGLGFGWVARRFGRRHDGTDRVGREIVTVTGGGTPGENTGLGLLEMPTGVDLAVVAAGQMTATDRVVCESMLRG